MKYPELNGKVVLVTGGSAGIGAAAVRMLRNNGANVFVLDVDEEAGASLVAEKNDKGEDDKRVVFIKTDVTDQKRVSAVFDAISQMSGSIDVLVNNAGITESAKGYEFLSKVTKETLDRVVGVNLYGMFWCAQKAAELMATQDPKGGVIINLSSVVAPGSPAQSVYTMTKMAARALTGSLSQELYKRSDIRVNTVSPGYTNTDMVLSMDEKLRENLRKTFVTGQYAEPEEVAELICELAVGSENGVNRFTKNGVPKMYLQ